MYKPLAEELRPNKLGDIVGQQHLLSDDGPLAIMVRAKKPQSLILWGPPGVGKTTLANILINEWQCESIKLSAVFSGVREIKEALDYAVAHNNGLFASPVVLFIDEIHRFNKMQQDSFLHHLEEGKIFIIGATTENPSFALNNALLSRMQVCVLNVLTRDDLNILLDKALSKIETKINIMDDARLLMLDLADGDARRLFNLLEMVINTQAKTLDVATLQKLVPNSWRRFDKDGEEFYNQISALHKSIRGSSVDASLYWFMRMLDGGADPLYLGRRLLRIAWEDIGLADINAASLVNAALQTYERLGSPEGELALANCVIYLAVTPKSNSAYLAYSHVREFVGKQTSSGVPVHLRNSPTKLMADLGYGREYKYAHDYPEHYVPNENYWPDEINATRFYSPSTEGMEARIRLRLEHLNQLDKESLDVIKK